MSSRLCKFAGAKELQKYIGVPQQLEGDSDGDDVFEADATIKHVSSRWTIGHQMPEK